LNILTLRYNAKGSSLENNFPGPRSPYRSPEQLAKNTSKGIIQPNDV